MATTNNESSGGGYEDAESLSEIETPQQRPVLTASALEFCDAGINNESTGLYQYEYSSAQSDQLSWSSEFEQTVRPRSDLSSLPSTAQTLAVPWTMEDLQAHAPELPPQRSREGDPFAYYSREYHPTAVVPNRSVVDLSRATSTSTLSTTSENGPSPGRHDSTSASQSPEKRPPASRDFSIQTITGPTSDPQLPRPTSVPNLPTQSTAQKRRGDSKYPNYPDQSFAALQSQHYPPSYHPLRTRSSHPAHSVSYSPSSSRPRDYSNMPSGAKTVGNTPAQSPGLFTPTISRSKNIGDDSEESHYNTPLLHPTHLQAPKETHKLTKDVDPVSGRKLVNDYEIFQKLGSGQHGTVKLGRNIYNHELAAIKIVRRFSKKLRLGKFGDPNDMTKKEVAILKKARHPHVVSLLEVIDDDEFGKVYLVLEYVRLGEIVWRRRTDKDIAIFEMNRIKREKEQHFDEKYEIEEIERFNATVPSRRAEKARVLEEQKRQALDRLNAKAFKSRDLQADPSPFWSLEYATEVEEEQAFDPTKQPDPSSTEPEAQIEDHMLIPDANPSFPVTSNPVDLDTPRPRSSLSLIGPLPSKPRSSPNSHPASPVRLEGHMHVPIVSDQRSHEVAFQSTLAQIISEQSKLTAEEEEFIQVPCLTISQARDAFRDTVLGLEYLHYQGIIHRDIKPANLLWTADHRVKISDFGVSYLGKPIREDDNNEEIAEADAEVLDEAIELAKTVGTPAFYAPELCDPELFDFDKNPERPLITGQIDVWALGVTLYAMIFGRLPFFDANEFAMYEKIARQEVFIPRLRLKGAEDTVKAPTNMNKRPDDVLEYEEIDDELRDLLKKLLNKQPSRRISLKDVKHHPWVLRGITDQSAWVDETDPSVQSEGKKIEVSTQEVQEAVVGVTIVDRIKSGIRRLNSVVRGRDARKRGNSNVKALDNKNGSPSSQDGRRSSLSGGEQIYSALRASREGSEHPLSQSVAVSPEMKSGPSYFDNVRGSTAMTPNEDRLSDRPSFLERTLSNAESTKTIRASVPAMLQDSTSPSTESLSLITPVHDATISSSLRGIFGGAGRRFVNGMRSRERGRGRESPSQSSRSSSVSTHSTNLEDPHSSPSVALSSVVAAGHVDHPFPSCDNYLLAEPTPAKQSASVSLPRLPGISSSEAFRHPVEDRYRRQSQEYRQSPTNRRRTISSAADIACSLSPSPSYKDFFRDHPHSIIHSDDAPPFGISSSSDQIASGISESTSHPSIPSVISGASSLSANLDKYPSLLKESSHPSTIVSRSPKSVFGGDEMLDHFSALNSDPVEAKSAVDDDEAGYNGEGELDSDSDDGIEMGAGRRR